MAHARGEGRHAGAEAGQNEYSCAQTDSGRLRWAHSLGAVLTARAAAAVLPVMKSLESLLIGIVAIRNGVLSEFSIDSDDVEDDDDDDELVAVPARVLKLCGEERLCNACDIPETTHGPDDVIV